MLNSLYIKNYRNLKELQIDSVAQVNLLCGKNNTGKSSVLEALGIYASGGDINYLVKIITQRGENVESNAEDIAKNKIILSLQSIFHGRNYNFDTKNKIKISENNGTIHSKSISMHFQKELGKRTCLNINDVKYYADDDIYQDVELNEDNFQFVTTGEIDSSTNAELFDTIVLSEKEDWVINALKIVEEKAERIAFVNEEGDRKPVIRTSSRSGIVPLQSMGDGINRILTIILAAVNCENGFLLIDEFENGLHYTVQEQLWKIIFKLAKDLNIQVFATTHSSDCIHSFSKVLNEKNNEVSGKLIRLDNKDGEIKATEYSAEDLRIAAKHNIETR